MSDSSPRDVVRGRSTPEGIALETGYAEKDSTGRTRRVRLTDRVVLTPAAARHLAVSLEDALSTRRSDIAGPAVARAEDALPDRVTPRGRTPVHAEASSDVEISTRLMAAVSALDIPYQHERSVRLAPGRLQANRYLLTCNVADLGTDPLGRILAIVEPVGMPGVLRDVVSQRLATAACVHFGFEEHDGLATCKLYLEQALDFEQLARQPAEPVLLHRAFKWQPRNSESVGTDYLLFPGLDAPGLRARVGEIYGRIPNSHGAALVGYALDVALGCTDAQKLAFMHVSEDDNPRDSFDLNVYEAGLTVKALQTELFSLRERLEIPRGRFQALYDQIRNRQLGHIAGGLHRNGEEFVTIYYGLAGFPRFGTSLGVRRSGAERPL